MHQYTSSTVFTTTDVSAYKIPIWQIAIPRLAFRHDFVLHGILGLSALHLKRVRPSTEKQDLLQIARFHQEAGLKSYIPQLSNISQANSHSLFAYAMIIGVAHIAQLTYTGPSSTPRVFINDVVNAFKLLRGAVAIAVQGREHLRQGPLALMMVNEAPKGPPTLDAETRSAFEILKQHINMLAVGTNMDESDATLAESARDCYNGSIEQLEHLFERVPDTTPQLDSILRWTVFAHDAYLDHLLNQEPAALAIFAYYGVILDRLGRGFWWLQGVGARLIDSIAKVLSEDWQTCLAWPIKEVAPRAYR